MSNLPSQTPPERKQPNRRTVRDVLEARQHTVAGGCCERWANQMACDCLVTADTSSEYDRLLLNRESYLIVGDIDKPFHRPECECGMCELWRTAHCRPTHAKIRRLRS